MVLGISGKIHTGKTALSELVTDMLTDYGISVARVSFGSLLKEEASKRFGFPIQYCYCAAGKERVIFHPDLPSQSMTVREILQWWGTDVRRAENPAYWVHAMEMHRFMIDADVIIIDDVRFPNEADWVLHSQGGMLVRLFPYDGWIPGPYAEHVSETALDRYKFSTTIAPEYGELPYEADILQAQIRETLIQAQNA